MKIQLFIILGVAALMVVACEKNTVPQQDAPVTEGARIKFIHAAPEVPGIDLYVGDTKLSSSTPTATGIPQPIAFGSTFPGTNANYAVASAGQQKVKMTTPSTNTATPTSTPVTDSTLALENDKYYSLFLTRTGAKPRMLLVNDVIPPSDQKLYVRFINLVPDTAGYDLAVRNGAVLFQNVKFNTPQSFVGLDPNINPTFELRQPGTQTAIGGVYTLTSSATGRVITLFAQGLPGKAAPLAPRLNGYVNR